MSLKVTCSGAVNAACVGVGGEFFCFAGPDLEKMTIHDDNSDDEA